MSNGDVYQQDFSREFVLDQDVSLRKTKAPTKIKKLRGIKRRVLKKLREAGIHYVDFLIEMSVEDIINATELSKEDVNTVVNKAFKKIGFGFKSAYDNLLERKALRKLTTGSKDLDKLLGGGIETRAITEFFGEYSTGKTQIAHQLCVNVQLPYEEGGLEGNALYFDTEGKFRPERIIQMARAKFLDINRALSKIIYRRFTTSKKQMLVVKKLEFIKETIKEKNIKLIVVDSIIHKFRSEYAGKKKLVDRQQKIKSFVNALMNLAEGNKELAVVITNQVTCDPDVIYGDPIQATGGNVVAHSSTYRVYLKKGKGVQRLAKLVSAPHLPENEAIFCITEDGITD